MEFFSPSRAERCTRCGECLVCCPVLALSAEDAVREMNRLLEGKESRLLSRCESCFTCTVVCPEGVNVARLILDRWHEQIQKDGLACRAEYFLPHSRPNFRTFVVDRLPEEEKSLLRRWEEGGPAEEIFFPGCNWITAPYLARGQLFSGLTIRGSLERCCGEMYFRMGWYEKVEECARGLQEWLAALAARRMIIPCTAGWNLFTHILPQFGFDYKIEIEHFLFRLLRQLEKGELQLQERIPLTVTIQDSCHAKAFGAEFLALPRQILQLLGVQVIERRQQGENTLCCGIGGGFSPASAYNPLRLLSSTIRTLRRSQETGAQAIVTYCAGCLQMLSVGRLITGRRSVPVYHVVELVQKALGEPLLPEGEKKRRAFLFLAGAFRHQTPALFSFRRLAG